MPTGYDSPDVYDKEKTDSGRTPAHIAADDQKKAELRDLEKLGSLNPIADKDRNTNVKGNETNPSRGLYAKDQKDDSDQPNEPFLSKIKNKIKGTSRRKKAAAGAALGGGVLVIIFASLISSTYRIPSLIGGLDDNVNSSRMVRLIVERRFERMLVEWQLQKHYGLLDDERYVKKNSLLGKLYQSFDIIGLEKVIEQQNGIKFRMAADGKVHVYLKGKDMGAAGSWSEYKELKKKHKPLAKQSKRMVTHTVPIARYGLSSTVRRVYTNKYGIRFATPKWDEQKSRDENIANLRDYQIEQTSKGTLHQLRNVFRCILDNDCAGFDDSNKPVDTSTESPKQFSTGSDPEGRNAQIVSEEADKAYAEAKELALKNGGSFTDQLVEQLTKGFIDAATARAISASIPVLGQIDLLSELEHISWTSNELNLADKIPTKMKEQAYVSISAVWKGFADNMKLGKMHIAQVNELNAQIAGAGGALAYHYAFKGVTNIGEPIDPPVGSSKQRPTKAAQDFIFRKTGYRIGHEVLNRWYTYIHPIFNFIEDTIGGVLMWAFKFSGIGAAYEATMIALFGENWQAEFGKWAARSILELFGATIDPLAKGAKLFNYLYIGTDVFMNTYCQTNLGCKAVTALSDKGFFEFTLKEDRELYMSSLTWNERIFSLDEPNSLANATLRELPGPLTPGNAIHTVASQLSLLPARLLGITTGKTFAAETPQQDVDIAETRQFGMAETDLDRDIALEVREQEDPQCPENSDDKVNHCQMDKEVAKIGLCRGTDCPEFIDPTGTEVIPAGNASGPVSTTGDIRALAKQLLALRDSGQIKMNSGVVQDLERTRDNQPISTCGVKDLDPALLNLLLRIAQRYKYTIWNIVTGHECNFGRNHFHPQGQASDIGAVNGEAANLGGRYRPLMNATLAREFALYVAGSMPTGRGGMGQSDCTVLVPVNNWPEGVEMFPGDSCNHFHIDVGEYR